MFPIVDARKTLARINAEAGTMGQGLRATFASIAEELVSGGVLNGTARLRRFDKFEYFEFVVCFKTS